MTGIIPISPVNPEERALLGLAREVATLMRGLPWMLVGGLMVRIIEAEHGVAPGFTTGDIDTVFDVRAASRATEEAAARLQGADFEPVRLDENLTYRFKRGWDIVDVLAPDHLDAGTSIITVPPDSTTEALGSRQALKRLRVATVDDGLGPFDLPLPSLVGAIVIKAQVSGSIQNRDVRAKHERDLARLLALVVDPVATRAELTNKERGYLRTRSEMADPAHRAWVGVENAEDGAIALSILAGF